MASPWWPMARSTLHSIAKRTRPPAIRRSWISRLPAAMGPSPASRPPAWSQTFTFDAFGNITKSGSISWQPTYSSPANNQYLAGWENVSYDKNGNLLNDTFNTYTWDVYGDLASANGATVTYDAFGRMVENHSGRYQLLYSPGGGPVLAEASGQNLFNALLPLPGGATAVYSSSGLAQYNHADWLGSARLFSSTNQNLWGDVCGSDFMPCGMPSLGPSPGQVLGQAMSGNIAGALQLLGAIPNDGVDCTTGICIVNPIMDATDAYANCNQQAVAAAAPALQALATPPSKYDVAGGGILAIAAILAKLNPWSIAIGAGTIFRKNIGGAVIGTLEYNYTFQGCMTASGISLPHGH